MRNILQYNGFIATVQFSSEDDIFFGKILGVDDSITFEGSSISLLKKAFKEAVDEYVAICEESGKEVLKSYKGSFNVRIKPELHKEAVMKSGELGISLNQFVEDAIANFVKESISTYNLYSPHKRQAGSKTKSEKKK